MDPRGAGIGSDRFASGVEARLPSLLCSAAARRQRRPYCLQMRDGEGAATPALQAAEGWPQLRRAIRNDTLAQIHGGFQNACWLSRASTESTPVGYFNPCHFNPCQIAALAACKTLAESKQ